MLPIRQRPQLLVKTLSTLYLSLVPCHHACPLFILLTFNVWLFCKEANVFSPVDILPFLFCLLVILSNKFVIVILNIIQGTELCSSSTSISISLKTKHKTEQNLPTYYVGKQMHSSKNSTKGRSIFIVLMTKFSAIYPLWYFCEQINKDITIPEYY